LKKTKRGNRTKERTKRGGKRENQKEKEREGGAVIPIWG